VRDYQLIVKYFGFNYLVTKKNKNRCLTPTAKYLKSNEGIVKE